MFYLLAKIRLIFVCLLKWIISQNIVSNFLDLEGYVNALVNNRVLSYAMLMKLTGLDFVV